MSHAPSVSSISIEHGESSGDSCITCSLAEHQRRRTQIRRASTDNYGDGG